MQILGKLTKYNMYVTIEKSKLFLVIPKTISVIPYPLSLIPYPYNYLVSHPLSLKLFGQLSLIPTTPNRVSVFLVLEVRDDGCNSDACGDTINRNGRPIGETQKIIHFCSEINNSTKPSEPSKIYRKE